MLKLRTSDSKRYWTILKTLTGRGKKPLTVPTEVLVGDQVMDGAGIFSVWQEAFAKLGTLDHDNAYDNNFSEATSIKVGWWAVENLDAKQDDKDSELNQEIELEEVVRVVKKLKNGKAAGPDGVCSEILKYGGPTVIDSLWRLCTEIFFRDLRTGRVDSSSRSTRTATSGYQITIGVLPC